MPLNDRQIKNAKPADKPYKLADGGGLYLAVTPSGGKLWRLKYRIDGKEKLLSIGKYPAVSLVEAREAADNARKSIAAGIDPAAAKQQAKKEKQAALLNTFEHLARQWHKDNLHRWKPNHAERLLHHFERDVFPTIGQTPIDGLAVSDIKAVLERIAERGAVSYAEKIRQWIGAVYDYAAMLEITDRNPARALAKFLPKPKAEHMPALPKEDLAEFYRRLLLADVTQQNRIALLLIMLVFVRNNELRGGQWAEIDFKQRLWTIPAARMKRPRIHLIPLSDWAAELLQELHTITGDTPYLFPSRTKQNGYISENTLGKIMNGMGYKGRAVPHGFRRLASTILNEQGFRADPIERQLAHVEENKIRSAYNAAEYLEERAAFMQWYSDYLRERYRQALAMLEAGETKAV
ncbi:tyrosine-type recombinase/integrase [Neisseria lisongii]|uniref:Integrase arm-type DNA-binding domain-containing protein n=1 Tax=Neisseria lisongii TaxID=2912188 RepID=A0AAW5AKN8_9NEIS|nr:integrase arm-type DNA-binding domain-containing protein [Neisseria lisongii]MCF7528662.1 integrase arm-type DNA-binding domain-containing protein [Neisseria lisongii]MCF7529520.1 integrase arm-type DNA-binding domain-containing protein [Neisseria lisongii]